MLIDEMPELGGMMRAEGLDPQGPKTVIGARTKGASILQHLAFFPVQAVADDPAREGHEEDSKSHRLLTRLT
jgi:hypothetical protein